MIVRCPYTQFVILLNLNMFNTPHFNIDLLLYPPPPFAHREGEFSELCSKLSHSQQEASEDENNVGQDCDLVSRVSLPESRSMLVDIGKKFQEGYIHGVTHYRILICIIVITF